MPKIPEAEKMRAQYFELVKWAVVTQPDNRALGLFEAAMGLFISHPDDIQRGRISVAALLSLAERDTSSMSYAALVANTYQSEELKSLVRDVVRVRRNPEAIKVVEKIDGKPLGVKGWFPTERFSADPENLDAALAQRGAKRLITLAEPTDENPWQRTVAVALTADGSIEVVKEIRNEADGPLEIAEFEHALLLDLWFKGFQSPVSVIHFDVRDGVEYMRRTFAYGCPLSETKWKSLTPEAVGWLAYRVAKNLSGMHARGVMYLDLCPENILTDGTLFDLSHGRRSPLRGGEVDSFIIREEYTSPETVLRRKASTASDVFSLGVLLHTMLTGNHPFMDRFYSDDPLLTYSVPNALFEYGGLAMVCGELLRRMLAKDPAMRPTMEEVAEEFSCFAKNPAPTFQRVGRHQDSFQAPVALLPMRCGVPHNGHINLITRLMDLGFFVQVSLQKSYTWSSEDPLPKWEVAKMLRAAVAERGYPVEDMDVMLTPFEDLASIRMHFLMSPRWENTKVIVSGNPGIPEMFETIAEERPILDARSICGDLTDANGTRLREAMLCRDEATVHQMMPLVLHPRWREMLNDFPTQEDAPIDFPVTVTGSVIYKGEKIHTGIPVRRYEFPEAAVLRRLKVGVVDRAYPHTRLNFRGESLTLVYTGQTFDRDGRSVEVAYELR